jgi:hypothetical protein
VQDDTLKKVQEKAVQKMVSGLKGTTYKQKCEELGLQILVEMKDSQDMALVHKFLTEKGELTCSDR